MAPTERETAWRAWLDKVDAVRGLLTAHAAAAEAAGRLAEPVVRALADAGFFTLKLPRDLGGVEADPLLQQQVFEALSYIHPAAGWVVAIANANVALTAPYLSDAGIALVYAGGAAPMLASSVHPAGTATPVPGGYRLSGRWRFASGIHHARWVLAGATVDGGEADQPARVVFLVLPVTDVQVHDSWNVVGLRATGSCDFSIDGRFVPDDLAFCRDAVAPRPRRGGPLYRLGVPGIVTPEHIGFALGVAQRALEELLAMAGARGRFRPQALAERPVVHRFVGVADLRLRAARALAHALADDVAQRLRDEAPVDARFQSRSRAVVTYATDIAVEIVTQAFRYGGAGALFQPNVLELLLRDVNAAAQHLVAADANYEAYGGEIIAAT